MGFQTAFRPRPIRNERPPMPVVPIERVRPTVLKVVEPVEITPAPVAQISLRQRAQQIKLEVARAHGVSLYGLDNGGKSHHFLVPRREAILRVHQACPMWGTSEIGRFFNCHHSTISNALEKRADEHFVLAMVRTYDEAVASQLTGLPIVDVADLVKADEKRKAKAIERRRAYEKARQPIRTLQKRLHRQRIEEERA